MTVSVDQRIGANVARYRAALGLTQSELAHRVGAHQQMIAKVEGGHRPLKFSEAVAFAEALGTDLDDLAAGPGPAADRAAYRQRLNAVAAIHDDLQDLAGNLASALVELAYTEGLNRVAPDDRRVNRNTTRHTDRWLSENYGNELDTMLREAVASNPTAARVIDGKTALTVPDMLAAVTGSVAEWHPGIDNPGPAPQG